MQPTFERWIVNWRTSLAEIVIISGTAGSAVTTFLGARKLVNNNIAVAVLLTLFFQGGLFVVAHHATDQSKPNHRPRVLVLILTWLFLAFFSVYSSAIGAFELVKDSLNKDHSRNDMLVQWQSVEEEISGFKTKGLSNLSDAKQEVELKLNLEKDRKALYEKRNRYYPPSKMQSLVAKAASLADAETKLQGVQIAGAPPSNYEEAVKGIDRGFEAARLAYAALPENLRNNLTVPSRPQLATVPDDLQRAFWAEVKAGSAPALVILFIAALMDFLPALLRYASKSKKSIAEKITKTRLTGFEIWNALFSPLSPSTTAIRVLALGHTDLDITLNIANAHDGMTLREIGRDLMVVTNEVAAKVGHAVNLRSVMTSSHMEIVPDLPLLDQLDDDMTLHLQFEGGG